MANIETSGKTRILLTKSAIPNKLPDTSGMTYGEVFVNYASGVGTSFLSTKKNDDTLAQFMEKSYNDGAYADKGDYEKFKSDVEDTYATVDALSALTDNVIKNEYVIAHTINTLNQSAGFDENGNSTLGMSLTDAIKELQENGGNSSEIQGEIDEVKSDIEELSGTTMSFSGSVANKFAGYYTSAQTDTEIATAKDQAISSGKSYTDAKVNSATSAFDKEIEEVKSDFGDLSSSLSALSGTLVTDYATSAAVNTIISALTEEIIDNELVTSTSINKINESAGFDENGNSTIGKSLTDAIVELQSSKSDTGHTHDYLPITGGTVNGNISVNGSIVADSFKSNGFTAASVNEIGLTGGFGIFITNASTIDIPAGGHNLGSVIETLSFDSNAGNQIYHSTYTSGLFYRSRWDGEWRSWRKFLFEDSDSLSPKSGTLTVNGEIALSHSGNKYIIFPEGEYIDKWGNIRLPSTSASWSVLKNDQPLLEVKTNGTITANGHITSNSLTVNNTRFSTVNGIPAGFEYGSGVRGTKIWSNGISMCDPILGSKASDAGWIRHIEETENKGTLEIAVGDNNTDESIKFRYYNTSNEIGNEILLPRKTGTLALLTDNVASATKATQDGSGNVITSTYATKTELNNGLAAKSDTGHTHSEYLPSSKAITHDTGTTRYLMGVSTTDTTTLGSASIYTSSKVYSNGSNLYATSDETLKDFISDIDCDLEALSKLPKKYFTWKGDESKTVEIGTSAQKVKELYPEMVTVDPNEKLGVAYDKLSVVALAAIDKLYAMYKESQEEIKELKSRIEELEK